MEKVGRTAECGVRSGWQAGIEGCGDPGKDLVTELTGVSASEIREDRGGDVAGGLGSAQLDESIDAASELAAREPGEGIAKSWVVGPGDPGESVERVA
jgi:hypothetical protein